MDRVTEALERLPVPAFGLLALVAVGAPLALALLVEGVAALAAGGAAALLALWAGLVGLARHRAASLPLEIAPVAVRGRIDGHPAFGFRVRLGRGRRLRDPAVEVVFCPGEGEGEQTVDAWVPEGVGVGPVTVVAVDPGGRCQGGGTLAVRVRVKERERTWEAERRFPLDQIEEGRFAPVVRWSGDRLRWDRSGWDTSR